MPIIQKSDLGKNGYFGNQLFQYVFGKSYALKYGCDLQVPSDWMGRELLDIDDGVIEKELPPHLEQPIGFEWGKVNIDLIGLFYGQHFTDIIDLQTVRKIVKFQARYYEFYKKREEGYVCAHVRRNHPVSISMNSYFRAFEKYGIDKDKVIFVSDGEGISTIKNPSVLDNYSFLHDFFLLMNADIIFRAASSFSFWASVLAPNAKTYAPIVANKGSGDLEVDFELGNHHCMASSVGFGLEYPHAINGVMYY